MGELLVIGIFIWIVYALTKKPKNNNEYGHSSILTDTERIDVTSKNYIQGYLDGFNDHKRNIENIHITQRFSNPNLSNAPSLATSFGASVPQMTAAELKEKHHLQNINTALYMACFLLVVAAAMFMGEALSKEIRFAGVWFVTLGFYISGLVIHQKSPKLRAAAVAFIGTGLALIPFTGLALNYFILTNDPAACWLITSIIGLFGYIFAAMYLRSQTIAYFAIAFMVSLSTSGVASLKLALMWYFVAVILVGSLLTLIAVLAPKSLPKYFSEPIEKTNTLIVPLALVASIFSAGSLLLSDYGVILSVCTLYYLVVALTAVTANSKMYSFFAARLLGTIAALVICYDLTDSYMSVGLMLSILAIIQLSISSMLLPLKKSGDMNNETWLWLSLGMQLVAPLLIISDESWPIFVIAQMSALLISSLSIAYYLRRAELSLFGTVAATVLTLVWGLKIMVPALENQWLSMIFAAYVMVVLAIRYSVKNLLNRPVLRQAILASFGIFLAFMVIIPFTASESWVFTIWLMAALFSYVLVYLEKKPTLSVLANVLLFLSMFPLSGLMTSEDKWMTVVIAWLGLAVFYAGYVILGYIGRNRYQEAFWWFSVAIGAIFGLLGLVGSDPAIVSLSGLACVVASSIVVFRGWKEDNSSLVDFGVIFATLGLQRIAGVNITEIDFLVYTHWWALTFATLGMIHYQIGQKHAAKICTVIGLAFITFFGFTTMFGHMLSGDDNFYSILFFIEHAAILIYGLVTSAKMQRNWGIVSLVLYALWMMQGISFALPAVVAVVLIAFAIYSLSKQPSGVQNK